MTQPLGAVSGSAGSSATPWGHDVPLRELLTSLLDAHLALSRALIDSLSKPLLHAPSLPPHLPQPQSASTAHLHQALTQVDAQLQAAVALGAEHARIDARVVRLCERVEKREEKVRKAQRQLGGMKRDMDSLVGVAMETRRKAEKAMSNPLDSNMILTHAATLAQTTSAPAHLLATSSLAGSSLVEAEQQPAVQQMAASGATSGLPHPTETQLRSGALGARPPTWNDFLAGTGAKVEEETRDEAYGGGGSAWGAAAHGQVAVPDEDAFELDLN